METRIGKGILCAAALAGLFAATSASASRSDGPSDGPNDGMDTCIQAFVAQELPQGHPIKVVTREVRDLYRNHQPAKEIVVKAKGKRTGKSYGSATCVVDAEGGLLAIQVDGSRIRVAKSQAAERSAGG